MLRPAPLLMLLVANLLWGSSLAVAKLALGELTPLQLSAWRMILSGAVVLPWLLREQVRSALPRETWAVLGLAGLLGFALSKFLTMWGLNLTTATDTTLLVAVEPLFTIALGRLVLREALTRRRLAAFVVGALGAYLLIARGLRPPSLSAAHVVGDLVFVLALTAEAACSVLGKSVLGRVSGSHAAAATIVAPLGLWLAVAVGDGWASGWPAPHAATLAAVAYLALGCTVVAYWAWFRALERLEAGLVGLTLFVQPLWGAALAVLLLGEVLHAATVAGGALVLFSLYLALGLPLRPALPGRKPRALGPPLRPGGPGRQR